MWGEAVTNVNVWAVLVSGVLSMVMGGLWYGPLFGKAWASYTGWTEDKVAAVAPSRMAMSYGLSLVAAVVSAAALAVLARGLGLSSVVDGLVLGGVCGVGFVAMAFGTTFLFEQKKLGHWLVVSGYEVVYITVAGVLVTVWR